MLDFADDNIFNFTDAIEVEEVNPSEIGDIKLWEGKGLAKTEHSQEILNKAYNQLKNKYDLSISFDNFNEFLSDLANFNVDDPSNDLVVSKIAKTVIGRTILRGIVTQTILVNKVFDAMEAAANTITQFDEVTIAMVSKGFEFLDALSRLEDKYAKAGVEETLIQIKKEVNQRDISDNEERVDNSTVQEIIKLVQSQSISRNS